MPKIDRLSGHSDWIELSFVERERTPRELMELGIRLYFAGLSLSNTVRELEKFGVERSRKAVHEWYRKRIDSQQLTRTRITLRSTKP
jgi:transposase-like protein